MPEYYYGAVCHYCARTLTLRVDIEDIFDDDGMLADVSCEVDMDPWRTHIDHHRARGHNTLAA